MLIGKKLSFLELDIYSYINDQIPIQNITSVSQFSTGFSFRDVFILIIGGTGALIAIFLKEAVQNAIQKRTILWQLIAYLEVLKASFLKSPEVYSLYEMVKARQEKLNDAALKDKNSFTAEWLDQDQKKNALRNEISAKIKEAFTKNPDILKAEPAFGGFQLAKKSIEQRRLLLIDSKAFISDKDASFLGRKIAREVISFRSALYDVYLCFENIFEVAENKSIEQSTIIPQLVDQIIVQGETALIAYVRLERDVEKASSLSLPQLIYSVIK